MKTFFIGLALSPVVLFVIGLSFYFFGSIGGMIAIFSGLIGYYIYSNYYVKTN